MNIIEILKRDTALLSVLIASYNVITILIFSSRTKIMLLSHVKHNHAKHKHRRRSHEFDNDSQFIIKNPPKLFSKVGVAFLIMGMVSLFVIAQILGIILFTPIVFDNTKMLPTEMLVVGSYNGTVISYTMIFTFFVLSCTSFALVKWRIYKTGRKAEKTLEQKQSDTNVNVFARDRSGVEKCIKYTTTNYLAINRFLPKLGIVFFGLWIIFVIISQYITYLLDKNPNAFVDALYFSTETKWLLILVMVVVVPIYEELVFRGIIWSALREQISGKGGIVLASIFTSLIFALIHLQYDIYEMSVIFILALIFSYARHKSGSLLLPIVLHIINNGLAMWQYLYTLS